MGKIAIITGEQEILLDEFGNFLGFFEELYYFI